MLEFCWKFGYEHNFAHLLVHAAAHPKLGELLQIATLDL